MTPPQALFHTLLRPSILQILRATGYHSAKPTVLDSLTDLAARYLSELCHLTALYSAHNGSGTTGPDIVDVRMALQHMGALLPELPQHEQELLSVEDTRGTDEFVAWAAGNVNREIQRIAQDEGATDYLDGE
jgi:transcription initiation factor TFIID subunit 3